MKLRIKDAKKFSRFVSIVLVLIVITGCMLTANFASADLECDYQEVMIAPGDTLWEIACLYMKDTSPGKAVDDIIRLNNKDTAGVYVGEVIKVPLR